MREIAKAIIDQLGYQVSILLFIGIGVYQGIQVKTFILDIPGLLIQIVTVEAIPSTVTFSIVVLISGGLLLVDILRVTEDTKTRTDGPTIVSIIPAYQAKNVLHKSVNSLKQATDSNVEIVVVTETRRPTIQTSS